MLELVNVERAVQIGAHDDADDRSGEPPERKPPEHRSLDRSLLYVREHRDNPRYQRKEQVRANRLIGSDAQKDQQRRRNCAGADAAVRRASADDESDQVYSQFMRGWPPHSRSPTQSTANSDLGQHSTDGLDVLRSRQGSASRDISVSVLSFPTGRA